MPAGAGASVAAAPPVEWAPDRDPTWAQDADDLAAFRPIADTEVVLALMPMSVLKALVGFTTFLFAFGLRRQGAATWWFGFVLGALTAGALVGVVLVGSIRRVLREQQMLTGSLVAGGRGGHRRRLSFRRGGTRRWWPSPSAWPERWPSPPSTPWSSATCSESNQGRAFARFETRFQLLWVVGSFVPVVLSLPVAAGDLVMAVAAAVGAAVYMSSRRALETGDR